MRHSGYFAPHPKRWHRCENFPRSRSSSTGTPAPTSSCAASMTLYTWLVYGLGFILVLCLTQVEGLQCYGCNIIQGQRYVDVGCSNPEVLTCTHSHKGFKHRFCIKTESTALGIVLTSGCATSRHCQQQELPGVRIHCCDSDLCNSATSRSRPHYACALASLLMLKMWL
ncbi:uncharacterized protein LOC133489949 [Phyllopteryx taeniolatus]|uniref:uncharacterized protein LOC133489949 n=1 Tax=Phyllopteryx taeniolatus TaxID=161469 RepID=UPI002AD3D4F5|nr:uncharacterized protein LOC133489949 [Phyllopteryx taeniolatus]